MYVWNIWISQKVMQVFHIKYVGIKKFSIVPSPRASALHPQWIVILILLCPEYLFTQFWYSDGSIGLAFTYLVLSLHSMIMQESRYPSLWVPRNMWKSIPTLTDATIDHIYRSYLGIAWLALQKERLKHHAIKQRCHQYKLERKK